MVVALGTQTAPSLAAVGALPARAEVSASGGPIYSIPIEMTPGIGNMTPRLTVSYMGGNERSTLGVGFGIAGLSTIAPCRQTIAQDGAGAPISLTSADRYCLDGARLRLVSGTYGASGATYRTEVDRLARITSFDASYGRPGWFRVETRDGLVYEYGHSADAAFRSGSLPTSPVQSWAVNKVSDRAGNSIVYGYTNDQATRSFRPDYIRYTDSIGAGTGRYRVVFVYGAANRADTIDEGTPSATGSSHQVETKLLERINLEHDGSVYRQYLFAYGAGAGTNSRLASVQACAATTSDCLATTVITWQGATAGHAALVNSGATVPNNNAFAMDFNGDGHDDLVWSNGTNWWTMAGGPGGFGVAVNTAITSTNPSRAGYPPLTVTAGFVSDSPSLITRDGHVGGDVWSQIPSAPELRNFLAGVGGGSGAGLGVGVNLSADPSQHRTAFQLMTPSVGVSYELELRTVTCP